MGGSNIGRSLLDMTLATLHNLQQQIQELQINQPQVLALLILQDLQHQIQKLCEANRRCHETLNPNVTK